MEGAVEIFFSAEGTAAKESQRRQGNSPRECNRRSTQVWRRKVKMPGLCCLRQLGTRKNHSFWSVKIHLNFFLKKNSLKFLSGRGGAVGSGEQGCGRGRVRGMEGRGLWVE